MSKISELLAQIKNLQIQTKDLVEGIESGTYNSKFRGGGIEFSEVREYIPGDDVKRIDWNVSARYNSLFVKEFVEENELNVYVILDLSASNNFGFIKSKIDLSFEVAVSLMFLALKNNDRLGLGIFTDKLEKFIPSKKGKKQVFRIIKELIEYKPQSKKTDILKSLSTLENKLKRPIPGVKGVDVSFKGGVRALREATITWTCWDFETVEKLTPYFLSPGASVAVEFGWMWPGHTMALVRCTGSRADTRRR